MTDLPLSVIGTSSFLMEHSHGKSISYIKQTAIEVIEYIKSKGLEVRFSTEDSFRSNLVDLLSIYSEVDKIGVNRVGIADTVRKPRCKGIPLSCILILLLCFR